MLVLNWLSHFPPFFSVWDPSLWNGATYIQGILSPPINTLWKHSHGTFITVPHQCPRCLLNQSRSIKISLLFHLTSIGRVLIASTEPVMGYRASVYTIARKHKMWLKWYHPGWINWKTQNQTQSCVHAMQWESQSLWQH